MRNRNDVVRRSNRQRRRALGALGILVGMLPLLALGWHLLVGNDLAPAAPGQQPVGPRAYPPAVSKAALPHHRVYAVEKQPNGYMLTYSDIVGAETPLALLPDHFGIAATDVVAALELSPDLRYLAIDAQRDHGDTVWVVATANGQLQTTPADATGNFLHWLPDGQHFLFRPFLPVGNQGTWQPGLWIVDAATGSHVDVPLPAGMTSTDLIDAAPAPDGAQIILSVTAGLGHGSTVWTMNPDGMNAQRLFASPADVGLFAWSPAGNQIAYEAIADSTIPFQPAHLWVMTTSSAQRHVLATVDGGHGFAPAWSPDGQHLAFVTRLNVGDSAANEQAGLLQSAVQVIDPASGALTTIAAPAQTGQPRNIAPTFQADGTLTFAAMSASNGYGAAFATSAIWRATPASLSDHTGATGNTTYQLATVAGSPTGDAACIAIVP